MDLIWNNFFMLLAIVAVITIGIFIIGDQLSYHANQLSLITGISGGFIGFVLIAMITSIPEAVSTFVSIYKGYYGLAVGGVLGSNIVNVALLSMVFLYFRKKSLRMENSSIFSFLSSLVLLGILGVVVSAFPISGIVLNEYLIGIVFVLSYLFIMRHSYDLNQEQPAPKDQGLVEKSFKKILTVFILLSVCIVLLSILLVNVCKQMTTIPFPIYGKPLGENFVGTLVLALVTSIPELATTFQMIKRNYTSMAIENIAGSNVFNIMILVLASYTAQEVFWTKISLESFYTIFAIFVASLMMCIVSLIKESKTFTYMIHSIIIVIWILSLVLVF